LPRSCSFELLLSRVQLTVVAVVVDVLVVATDAVIVVATDVAAVSANQVQMTSEVNQ